MLESPPTDLSSAIPCHRCGYDVRAQPADGRCPECEASVAESRRLAPIPRRPAWRDSDPRWRRRMLAGAWVLVLVPLLPVLQALQWSQRIPVPIFSDVQRGQSLEDSLIVIFYRYLMFCVGIVLLFSRERNRRSDRFDWTRRWGVVSSYGVLLLGIANYALLFGLVIVGIGALFVAMPLAYQPSVTPVFVKVGTTILYHGPHATFLSQAALAAFSATGVLLACVPLFNALRSSGPRILALILLAPLALNAALQAGCAVLFAGPSPFAVPQRLLPFGTNWIEYRLFYFYSDPLARAIADFAGQSVDGEFLAEAGKWLACLGIAIWLSIAQIAACGLASVRTSRKTGNRR
jgi:hypothetical protein